jgi:4-amino-4-deoxy-L-arabinose transferase-like glycosyltransferase
MARNLLLMMILLLSAWIQFSVVERTEVIVPLRADAKVYFSTAYNLVHSGIYSQDVVWEQPGITTLPKADHFVTPGYPLFLALVGDPQPDPHYLHQVVVVQAALGVLSVWLMFLISTRFLTTGGALLAALFTAISPHLAIISVYLLTETLFVFFLFAAVYATIRALESRRASMWILAGLIWGLASLVRPVAEFVPVLILLATLLPRFRANIRPAALLFAGFLVAQAPWQVRNLSIPAAPDEPSLMVAFLNLGAYPNFMYEGRPDSYGIPYRFDPDKARNERDLSSVLGHISSRFREQPSTYLRWYLIGKPGFFLSWTNIDGQGDVLIYSVARTPYLDDVRFYWLRIISLLLHWPLMLLGFAGALWILVNPDTFRLQPEALHAARVVAGVFVYALVFHMIGAPLPRYGIPFRPLLYPITVLVVWTIWNWKSAITPRVGS